MIFSYSCRPILRVHTKIAVVFFALAVCTASPAATALPNTLPLPSLTSPQWLLQHWDDSTHTATTLASMAADVPTQPASVTKLLTAYTVLHALNHPQSKATLATLIPISALAVAQEGTKVGYQAGESVAVQDALQGMLAISGNDAAWALAEFFGQGNAASFVAQMNLQAQHVGLKHSQWQNPHGLTQAGHLSSAADLLAIAHALWQDFPQIRPWLGIKSYRWHGVSQANRNTLLWQDSHIDGLKTGHTDAAGYNLATTGHWWFKAGNDVYDWRLSTVTLGAASADDRAKDTATLLAWARNNFMPVRVFTTTDIVDNVSIPKAVGSFAVMPKTAAWLVLPKPTAQRTLEVQNALQPQSLHDLRYEFVPREGLSAPLNAGDMIGTVRIYLGDTLQLSVPAMTPVAIVQASFWARAIDWVKSWFYARRS